MSTFKREELLAVLEQCRPALADGGLMPELTHLWFDGKNVYAYHGGLGVRRRLASDLSCGFPGKTFLELLKSSGQEEVTIQEEKNGCTLKMGRARVTLATMQYAVDKDGNIQQVWPYPRVLPKEPGLKLSDEVFGAFKTLAVSKAGKPEKTNEQGVVFEVGHDATALYATDGRSIARVAVKQRSVSMPKFIVSWETISVLNALLSKKKDAQLWLLDSDKYSCVVAGVQGTMVCSNLMSLEGQHDLKKIMDGRFGGKMTPIPKGLRPMLERATILAGKDEPTVHMSMAKGGLRVQGKYAQGVIDDTLSSGISSSVKIKTRADLISRALPNAEKMAITERTFALSQGDTFQYVLGTME